MGKEAHSTEELIQKARAADLEAFAEVFRRHRDRLDVWLSLRLGPAAGSPPARDNLLKETFVAAYKSLDDLRDDRNESFRQWLFAVAESLVDELREEAPTGSGERPSEATAPGHVAHDDLLRSLAPVKGRAPHHRKDFVKKLLTAVARLPAPLRETLVLRTVEERSFEEIAERIGKPPSTARVYFLRALVRLRDDLAPRSRS
jgi:RNA polymerase sigma-70 factor (ECF subfamily)